MKRGDKEAHLSRLSDVLSSGAFLVGLNFSKLSAADFFALRKSVHEIGGCVVVVKNTVARLALSESSVLDAVSAAKKVLGPVVFVYGSDVVALAKIVGAFCKMHKLKLGLLFGLLDGKLISADDVVQLSEIPPINELRARLLYMISYAVPSRLVHALSACSIGLARILDSISRPSV